MNLPIENVGKVKFAWTKKSTESKGACQIKHDVIIIILI